jgi:hypothetical protein
MKAVKRYTTFEDLKYNERKTLNHKASLKKHNEFQKLLVTLRANKAHRKDGDESK